MDIVTLPIEQLKAYKDNPKIHSEKQIDRIAASIKEFGWVQPVVVDADYTIIAGHGRLLAAKVLELPSVPCVMANDLTEEQVRAFRLADNKLNESDWDNEMLTQELSELSKAGVDMSAWDLSYIEPFSSDVLDGLFGDAETEKKVKTIVCPKCGQTFEV